MNLPSDGLFITSMVRFVAGFFGSGGCFALNLLIRFFTLSLNAGFLNLPNRSGLEY